jgi:hypothetical protein
MRQVKWLAIGMLCVGMFIGVGSGYGRASYAHYIYPGNDTVGLSLGIVCCVAFLAAGIAGIVVCLNGWRPMRNPPLPRPSKRNLVVQPVECSLPRRLRPITRCGAPRRRKAELAERLKEDCMSPGLRISAAMRNPKADFTRPLGSPRRSALGQSLQIVARRKPHRRARRDCLAIAQRRGDRDQALFPVSPTTVCTAARRRHSDLERCKALLDCSGKAPHRDDRDQEPFP